MKDRIFNWQVGLGAVLIALSALVYYAHFLIFRDAHHIFLYLIGDIAFLFVEVLIVTLIVHKLLTKREKRAMLKKMNMVIGAFFSEVGVELIKRLRAFDASSDRMAEHMLVCSEWNRKKFARMRRAIEKCECAVDCRRSDIAGLRDFLIARRNFLLMLLENPNLLEHESFTNLLWAVFHLMEELSSRKDFGALPAADYNHLALDIKRVEGLISSEWLRYMEHLKSDYPYLFSLAVRTNPYDSNASIIIK